jgi:hypothetical protein
MDSYLKTLKNRWIAFVAALLCSASFWGSLIYMAWFWFDHSAKRHFEIFAVLQIIAVCLFFLLSCFVRCPKCRKCMEFLYRPGDESLNSRRLLAYQVYTECEAQCIRCKTVMRLGD